MRLEEIRIDGGTQARAKMNTATVEEYATALKEGVIFPPVVVFYDGTDYWLADGFNRYYANKGKCPKDKDLELLNLKQVDHQANGNQYQCWELIPATKPTGIKDELLLEMENTAFPNFNANTK